MEKGAAYWVLMLIWVLAGFWSPAASPHAVYYGWGRNIVLFLLLLILGWKAFGPPLQ